MKTQHLFALLIIILPLSALSAQHQKMCTYSTYQWNTELKKAVNFESISKPYRDIQDFERDAQTGCTVCEEDQSIVRIKQLPPIKLCTKLANKIEVRLNHLIKKGVKIEKAVGYRVGQTRGDLDENNNRTLFSNHSFGIAIDINDEHNGLYDNCVEFNSQCRLRKGGPWNENNPLSLHPDHEIVRILKEINLLWGGEILGYQKDFMHFSPSGY